MFAHGSHFFEMHGYNEYHYMTAN